MELEAMYNHFLKGNSGRYGSLTGQPLSASPAQAETPDVHSTSNFSPHSTGGCSTREFPSLVALLRTFVLFTDCIACSVTISHKEGRKEQRKEGGRKREGEGEGWKQRGTDWLVMPRT